MYYAENPADYEIRDDEYPYCTQCGSGVEDDFYIIDGDVWCRDCIDKAAINIYDYLQDREEEKL